MHLARLAGLVEVDGPFPYVAIYPRMALVSNGRWLIGWIDDSLTERKFLAPPDLQELTFNGSFDLRVAVPKNLRSGRVIDGRRLAALLGILAGDIKPATETGVAVSLDWAQTPACPHVLANSRLPESPVFCPAMLKRVLANFDVATSTVLYNSDKRCLVVLALEGAVFAVLPALVLADHLPL